MAFNQNFHSPGQQDISDHDPTVDVIAAAELELELAHSVVKPVDVNKIASNNGQSSSSFKLSNLKASKIEEDENIVSKNAVISGLFSTKKPRDISSAVGSSIKSITKGVVVGTSSLVLCPVVGVTNEGVSGFFKGVGAGVLAAITLPLAGIGVSVYQLGRGVLNTPKAICEKASGKVWNKQKRVWEVNWYSLEEEAKSLKDFLIKSEGIFPPMQNQLCAPDSVGDSTTAKEASLNGLKDGMLLDHSTAPLTSHHYSAGTSASPVTSTKVDDLMLLDTNANDAASSANSKAGGAGPAAVPKETDKNPFEDLFDTRSLQDKIGRYRSTSPTSAGRPSPNAYKGDTDNKRGQGSGKFGPGAKGLEGNSKGSDPLPEDIPYDYKNDTRVFETELYEVLHVPTNATQETIRRAYYKLAKKYHPDKNLAADAEECNQMFHKLGEAYQILGDEERRRKYDKHGRSAISDMPILDSQLFFSMLFGSDLLEPYIGKLRMALYLELELNDNLSPTTHDFEKLQQAREVQLALNLREFLRSFVCGELDEFRANVRSVVSTLCKNSFTVAIVETLGWTYQNYAKQYIGKRSSFLGISGRIAKSKQKSRSFTKGLKTFSCLLKTAILERSNRRNDDSEPLISDIGVNYSEGSIPVILDAMLNICLMDIQNTVRAACKRLLKDMSVDSSWRFRRAEALLEVGIIFLQVAKETKEKLSGEKIDHVGEIVQEMKARQNVHYSNDAFF